MGERFSGFGEDYSEWRFPSDKDPNIERKELYDETQRLLGKLVETGVDLSSQAKKILRQKIQANLHALGLQDISQLSQIARQLHEAALHPPTPPDYPTRDEIRQRLFSVLNEPLPDQLPSVWKDPTASEIAELGQGNWRKVAGRGEEIVDYIYGLGKILCNEFSYLSLFPANDAIEVGEGWKIENGRHRALTLKVLGKPYVRQKGLDGWVSSIRTEDMQRLPQ